jgi:hypothetical protein
LLSAFTSVRRCTPVVSITHDLVKSSRGPVTPRLRFKRRYAEHPQRFEYHLTVKGVDLYPALVALMQWGDHYLADPAGGPMVLEHKTCGQVTHLVPSCTVCGAQVTAREMRVRART